MKSFSALIGRIVVTLAIVLVASWVGWQLWDYYIEAPWTRDGHVRADVVEVAPDVSGLVTEVMVRDNQTVRKGDLIFRIDPQRFQLSLQLAEAALASQKATMEEAQRDLVRYRHLSEHDITSQQKLEQAQASATIAEAGYQQAVANEAIAKLNLERSEVHAPANGIVTNLGLNPGDYVTAGKGVTALVNTDTIHAEGYFEETKLHRIHIGDPVTIQLMGQKDRITGHVESIAGGIEDRERGSGSNLLADVAPTFSWVRLAQRIPIRIALDHVPESIRLIPGLTATVVVTASN